MDVLAVRTMFNALVRRGSAAGRFLRETRADTALEFAFIGTAFFLCMFAIFVFALDMYWQMALDDAVRNATRMVQTDKVKSGSDFVNAVCAEFGATAPNCKATLKYSVQSNTSFSAITPATFGSDGSLTPSGTFSVTLSTPYQAANAAAGTLAVTASPQFLLVQVAYLIPIKILVVPAGVATENGTPALLSSVATVMDP